MSTLRSRMLVAALALAALALLAAADRARPPGRVSAARASTASLDPRLPEFALFGWVSPPPESTTEARIAEYAGAGLDVAMPAWGDSGDPAVNRQRFEWAAGHGVRCIAWDRRLVDVDFEAPGGLALMDSVVADVRDQPGFLAYYFEDEPPAERFEFFAKYHAALRARDSAHVSFNNLLGRQAFPTRAAWEAYVREYVRVVQPAILCDDQYDFTRTGDRGQFVENVAGLAAIAREHGLPFWLIVQLIEHGQFRAITPGELRWQVAMALAYGARGIGYFTYWTPAPDPKWNWQYGAIRWDGTRSEWYEELAGLNATARNVGITLARATWLATEHAGSVPEGGTAFAPDAWVRAVEGRAALGAFAAPGGARYLLVANADSASAQPLTITFGSAARVERLGDLWDLWEPVPITPTARGGRLTLALEAGAFVLLRLAADDGALLTGRAPRLEIGPVPARGLLSLGASEVGERGRIEILDLTGRRAWGRDVPRGAAVFEWRGERDDGGSAAPGVYFVRIEDARGVLARRFAWLGR